MNKHKKVGKILSGLLSAVMLSTTLASFPVFADESTAKTFVYDDYTVTYDVTNSWGNTEVISVTLSNTSDSAIENWMLYFDPHGDIQYVNDATQAATSDGIAYIKNAGYNANIGANTSVTFSYAVNDCEEMPDDFTLCQTRVEKSSGFEVTLNVNEFWGDSFNGEIVIQNNTDAPIEAWELIIDTNFTITEITNSWAASVTELEPYSYLLKGTYTGTVAANTSVSLGFIGVKDGDPEITNYSLTEIVLDENAILWGRLLDGNISSDSLNDADNDGLPDLYEEKLGTDEKNADSDSDGLPDGYEVLTLGSDPLSSYSFDSNISDGNYDSDQDGLSNYQEYVSETDPNCSDSDYDGLSDGNEINTYGTNPLNPDTDGDGLSDGDEIALGLNPLVVDSDEDGIPDNEEKFLQNLTYDTEDADTVIDSVDVSFEGTGYINSTTSVENIMDTDWMCSNIIGLVGAPYDISSDSSFDTATLTFTVDKSSLGNTEFNDLAILWYNEEEQRFVEMETISDVEASTLTTTVGHFSKYLIVDCSRWYAAWNANYYPTSDIDLHTAITIDCSSSMNSNDPNRCRVDAAKGFVNVMHDNDMASVTLFASHVSTQSLGTLTKDKDLLKETIDNVTSLGVTNYEEALQHSIDSLDVNNNTSSENIIIFLSDGYPTNDNGYAIDPYDFDYSVVDTAAAAGIKIYTIGLTDNVCETVLKEMADRTGGEYFYANTAEELVPYFLNINVTEKYDTITDTDGDGVPDLFETYGMPVANGQVLFSDIESKDKDEDGIAESDPKDSDGDGLKDGEEVSVMYVNDDADAKLAAEYISEYYPDIEVNACGGIYFKMTSDPNDADTDGDLDLDNADPNPMDYQLNGYFAQKMGELQEVAREYIQGEYTPSSTDNYNGKKDLWLSFMFLRNFNKSYTSTCTDKGSCWKCTGGNIDSKFISYVSNNYKELYSYFSNFDENKTIHNLVYADKLGENHIDLYHLSATMSALIYNTNGSDEFKYEMADTPETLTKFSYLDGLAGIFGDGSQLINDLKKKSLITGSVSVSTNKENYIKTEEYKSNYNIISKNIGATNNSNTFSQEDLLSDVDAVNLYNGYIKNSDLSLSDVFTLYYSTTSTRYTQFKNNFLSKSNGDLYNRIHDHTWCYIDFFFFDVYGNPLLNENKDEGYVIAFSQALTDLLNTKISEEKN